LSLSPDASGLENYFYYSKEKGKKKEKKSSHQSLAMTV
jgi:hypothetical protein